MKDYNQMAQNVFRRRDEYLSTQKKKRAMLLKAGVPLCSLVLVALLGLTLWPGNLPEIPVEPVTPTAVQTENTEKNITATESQGTVAETTTKPVENSLPPDPTEPYNEVIPPVTETPDRQEDPTEKPTAKPTRPSVSGDVGEDAPETTAATEEPNDNFVPDMPPEWIVPDDSLPEWIDPPESDLPIKPMPTEPCIGEPTLPTEPVATEATEPTTGPVEITVGDKKYTAQTGDVITYTIELQAQEKFENIHLRIYFDGSYLKLIVPEGVKEEDYSDTVPNISDANVGYHRDSAVLVAGNNKQKYDFRSKKVLMTVDFLVIKTGKTDIDFVVQDMAIEVNSKLSGMEEISYFSGGKQVIFEGIEFYEDITVN